MKKAVFSFLVLTAIAISFTVKAQQGGGPCSEEGAYAASTVYCNQYYQCRDAGESGKIWVLLTCPVNQEFDDVTHTCMSGMLAHLCGCTEIHP